MNNAIINSVISFVEESQGIRKGKSNIESRIEEDLHIMGDDATELLIAFGEKFKVDVSNFMAAEYFNPEGTNWFMPTYASNKKTLTIAHLVKGVIAGKLDEVTINT